MGINPSEYNLRPYLHSSSSSASTKSTNYGLCGTSVFTIEKYLHISEPGQFKSRLFKGQLIFVPLVILFFFFPPLGCFPDFLSLIFCNLTITFLDIAFGLFLCFAFILFSILSCLVFSELPGSMVWCLTFIGETLTHYCFKYCCCSSVCFLFLVFSLYICYIFCSCLRDLGYSFLFSFAVSVFIFSSLEILYLVASILLISLLKAFFISVTAFLIGSISF